MALIIISRCDFTISDLDLCVAGCEIVVSYPKICLIVEVFRFAITIDFGMGGKRITQKAVASSNGSAIVAVAPMAAGKTSFPRCHHHHTHSHAKHDIRRHHKQKAAYGRKKSPAGAGTKTVAEKISLHPC